jgi:hypothetical protein
MEEIITRRIFLESIFMVKSVTGLFSGISDVKDNQRKVNPTLFYSIFS